MFIFVCVNYHEWFLMLLGVDAKHITGTLPIRQEYILNQTPVQYRGNIRNSKVPNVYRKSYDKCCSL